MFSIHQSSDNTGPADFVVPVALVRCVALVAVVLALSAGCSRDQPAADVASSAEDDAQQAAGDIESAEAGEMEIADDSSSETADLMQTGSATQDSPSREEREAEEGERNEGPAIPEDATADELFAMIEQAKSERGRTLETARPAAEKVVAAAAAINQMEDVPLEDQKEAYQDRLAALAFLAQFDSDARQQREDLIRQLSEDERSEIAGLARGEMLARKIQQIGGSGSKEDKQALIDEMEAIVEDDGVEQYFPVAFNFARVLTSSGDYELAADLYDQLSTWLEASSNERMQAYAQKMEGAARRLRLPGNFMQLSGTTAEGEPFDWESYRGNVVLVDFWASWCGPCRAEIPNMKRNLEAYGERGFEIVGVNLDESVEAYRQYVEQEEIPWVNLMSQDEDQRGWENPVAVQYGINSIPTAILVDEEGNVVSLSARGARLDALLAELIGPPEVPSETGADDESDAETGGAEAEQEDPEAVQETSPNEAAE